MQEIVPVILCGGSGTRLWPVSRHGMAKHLVPLINGETLLQTTLKRIAGNAALAPPILLGSHAERFAIKEQVENLHPDAELILEPTRRDTYASILLAAAIRAESDPDAVLVIMPSDHLIADAEAFHRGIMQACGHVAQQGIALIGVPAEKPATGLGYIKPGPANADGIAPVVSFYEKPDAERAARLVEEGWLWNAGLVCARAGWLLEAVRDSAPEAIALAQDASRARQSDLGMILPGDAFNQLPVASFDHGFLEQCDQAHVLAAEFGWSDLGDWEALWQASAKDAHGNAATGPVTTLDSSNNIIRAEGRRICTLGVSDLAIVETADAVLVAPKHQVQGVKDLVAHLTEQGHREALAHVCSHRPWGSYQIIDQGPRFCVKRITVKPGAKLSLQKHLHRAEHWVVVKGSAEITIGEDVRILYENQSVDIPIGVHHRLGNPGKIPLELIEVQTGSYLEEDDIIRFADDFGRTPEHILTPVR